MECRSSAGVFFAECCTMGAHNLSEMGKNVETCVCVWEGNFEPPIIGGVVVIQKSGSCGDPFIAAVLKAFTGVYWPALACKQDKHFFKNWFGSS